MFSNSQDMTAEQPSTAKETSSSAVAWGTPVERFKDGSWENGWVIHDAQDRDRITIAKLGNQMVLVRNLRWGIDLRECSGSPFTPTDETSSNDGEFDF